jgi:ABC-type amino acid transport substrate-binding protein
MVKNVCLGEWMAHTREGRLSGTCILLAAIFAAFLHCILVPSVARADDRCLRIAMAEATGSSFGLEPYRQVMKQVGVCVTPVSMPNARAVIAIRTGDVDAVFAGLGDFDQQAKAGLVHGESPLRTVPGLLVVREGTVQSLDELTNKAVGIWLGAGWAEDLMADYGNVMRCPLGPEMMQQLLRAGRLDAMLINEFSLHLSGGLPDGYISIPVKDLEVFTWVRPEFSDLLPAIEKGNAAYIKMLMELRQKASLD